MLTRLLPKRKKFFGVVCARDRRTSLMRNESMAFLMGLCISITIDRISCFVYCAVCGMCKNIPDRSLDKRNMIEVTIPFDESNSCWTSWMTRKKCWIKKTDCFFGCSDFFGMEVPRRHDYSIMVGLVCIGDV